MRISLAGILAVVVLLAGCASSTLYQPAPAAGDYGYRDISLTSDRYRVSFAGNNHTPRETVEMYALYRAAELALDAGYDRFQVVSRSVEPNTAYRGGVTTSVGGFHGFRNWAVGTGIGINTADPVTSYQAVLEILVGPNAGAEGNSDVYNAREVRERLGQRIARPDAAS